MTRFLVAAAVAAAVILGVAVARFVPSSSVGGLPAASPAPSAAGLTGSWTAQVGPNSAGALEGTWTVTFTDLQVFYRNPGGVSFSQGATYNGDQVTLDPDDCPSGTGNGTWRWVVSGDTLTLTVVSDPSACRSAVLGASPFQRATP